MEFFLTDPDIKLVPPAGTRVLDLRAEPYPDGKRLQIALDLTHFQQKPSLELTLTGSVGVVVAATSIVEPATCRLDFPLHIRKPCPTAGGVDNLAVLLSFPDLGEIDRRDINVNIPSSMV
jgi:hypothetical protein